VTFSNNLINPLLPIYVKQVGATGIYIGFVVASYSISRIVLEIPSGYISLKYGYFLPMSMGLLLMAAGSFLSAYAGHTIHLALARMLIGLGSPLFFTTSLGYIVKLFEANRRGSALGIFKAIQNIAGILGSIASGYVITSIGFRLSFIVSGILGSAALLALILPSTLRREPKVTYEDTQFSFSRMGSVFRNRNILILCSATLAMFLMTSGVEQTIFPIYANEQLGYSYKEIGWLSGVRAFGFVISLVTMGSLSDRINRRPVMLLGLGLGAVMVFGLSLTASFIPLIGLFFGIGLSVGAFWVVAPIVAAESLNPSLRGVAIGTYKTFFDIGSILGPIVLSLLTEASGYTVGFYVASALLVVNMLPTLNIRRNINES
jgi:MFS family permease